MEEREDWRRRRMWQRRPERVLCKPQFSIQLFLVAAVCIKCSSARARPPALRGRQAAGWQARPL